MSDKAAAVATMALLLAAAGVNAFYYPALPERLVTHWSAAGLPNGSMPKLSGIAVLPAIMAITACLFFALPALDPFRKSVSAFKPAWNDFIVLVLAFLFYTDVLMIVWNLGVRFALTAFLAPALGALFAAIGLLLPRTRRNWLIGIRTPWTLSNDSVWEKTHQLGGKLFLASGLVILSGAFFPRQFLWFVMAPILLSAAILIAYSYEMHKRTGTV